MARVRDDAVHSMGKLLALYESDAITSRLRSTSDIELFLDFVLDVCSFAQKVYPAQYFTSFSSSVITAW